MEIFQQEGWADSVDITMIMMSKVDGLYATNNDGSYKAKPMAVHVRRCKAYLMYYNRKCRDLLTTLGYEDVLNITKTELFDYMGSPGYHDDIAGGLSKPTKPTSSTNNKDELYQT